MPRLRFPDLGSRVVTKGRVMKRPASLGQHCRMGKSSREKLSRWMTSLQGAREKLSCFRQQGKHFEFIEKTLGRFDIHKHADASGYLVKRIDAKGELHAGVGTELVDEKL